MDLNDDEVGELFPDSREDRGMECVEDFHLGIDFGQRAHVVVYTEGEEFSLTEDEMEQMLDELECDTIWQCIGDRFKVLEYLRTHER
jgi:hypothetical protein